MLFKELVPDSYIYQIQELFPGDFCDLIIEKFEEDELSRKPGETGGGYLPEIKADIEIVLNPNTCISWDRWEQVDLRIKEILFGMYEEMHKQLPKVRIVGEFPIRDTGYQIQKYPREIGYYQEHVDSCGRPDITSQRIMSLIIYLNDVDRGGETFFPNWNLTVKPEKGKLLIFPPFWNYLHGGKIPLSNDKYIITSFFITHYSRLEEETKTDTIKALTA